MVIYVNETLPSWTPMENGMNHAQMNLQEKKTNTRIQQYMRVNSIIRTIRDNKYRRAGNIRCLKDNKWTIRVREWTWKQWTRSRGKPKIRWWGDLNCCLGSTWSWLARDKVLEEVQGGVPHSKQQSSGYWIS